MLWILDRAVVDIVTLRDIGNPNSNLQVESRSIAGREGKTYRGEIAFNLDGFHEVEFAGVEDSRPIAQLKQYTAGAKLQGVTLICNDQQVWTVNDRTCTAFSDKKENPQ